MTGTQAGRSRLLKSTLGLLPITSQQAKHLEVKAHTQLSPLLEHCSLRVSAQVFYQQAEEFLELLTGMRVDEPATFGQKALQYGRWSPRHLELI